MREIDELRGLVDVTQPGSVSRHYITFEFIEMMYERIKPLLEQRRHEGLAEGATASQYVEKSYIIK